MAGTIYSGTYLTGINLYNPATQRPVTVTGTIDVTNANAIFGDTAFAWTVYNYGTIEGTGTTGSGIQLVAGGVVNNESFSSGGGDPVGLIEGYDWGILIKRAPGTVTNSGTIEGTGTNGVGVYLTAGGRVTNGSALVTSALISGGRRVIDISGGSGTVTNFGTIEDTRIHTAVVLDGGGSVTNGSSSSNGALISGPGNAIYIGFGSGTVTNFGTIGVTTNGNGVILEDGGRIVNGSSAAASSLIVGVNLPSVDIFGAAGTVINFGTIQQNGTSGAVQLVEGGTVTNGASGETKASIIGPGTGIYIANLPGTISNFGTIDRTSTSSGSTIALKAGGSVTNFGTIENAGTTTAGGVYLQGAGTVTNGGIGSTAALISGAATGVSMRAAVGSVVNFGTITGSTDLGIYLQFGGSVTNQTNGVISGSVYGIEFRSGTGTVTNFGKIQATGAAGDGVDLLDAGSVANGSSSSKAGLISGTTAGVYLRDRGGTVTNYGTLEGGSAGFLGAGIGSNTLINFGTVASTAGTAGVAVNMESNSNNGVEALIVEKGAVFVGLVEGGGRGEIEFAANGTAPMGSNISGFDTVMLANGGADSLTLMNANFNGVAPERITVLGGNDGNTVNAGSVTAGPVTMIGGAGKDVFTGGSGQNVFEFSASTLTTADKVVGGGGYDDELLMTSAGTIAAGGVSGVEIYQFAGGAANTLDLANTNLAGLPSGAEISIYGGDDGNTISAVKVTNKTVPLTIYGGSGLDTLTGSAAGTVFVFAASDLTGSDTITGRSGNDELMMTTAGTVAVGGVSGVETYVLADGKANTLSLTAANFTKVTGSAITISDGDNGNTVSLASTAPAADHIIVYAGTGADMLTGGPGNDVFHAGGKTTMTGGAGANEFVFSAPGSNTIADFTASASNEMLFISGSGFSLPGATATPKALGSLFVQDSTGTFTAASQRFAYDTSNGKLVYSASGSSGVPDPVATLTGHPTLSASQISHLLFAT